MWKCHDCIYAFAFCLAAQSFCQLVDDTIYAAHCGTIHISLRTPTSPFAAVSFECQVFVWDIQVYFGRVVCIFQQAGKVCLDVVFVYPVSLFLYSAGVSDGIAVFNHIFAFCKIFQGELVSGRNILVQDNFLAVYYEFSPAGSATIATATLSAVLIFRYFVSIYYL